MLRKLNPAQILIVGFFSIIMIGSLLLAAPVSVEGGESDYLTALFTSTSAVCVTGLVLVDTATYWTPVGQVVIMLLFQIGGLGIMSFATFVALLLGRNIQLKQRLAMQQSINRSSMEGIIGVFKYLLGLSFVIESIGALVLLAYWAPSMGVSRALWYGVFHSISAFNNAGFDLMGSFASLSGFAGNALVLFTISFLFIAGSLSFIVFYELFKYPEKKVLSLHVRIVLITTLIMIAVGAGSFLILEYNNTLQGMTGAGRF